MLIKEYFGKLFLHKLENLEKFYEFLDHLTKENWTKKI
jgi:hypothetical protein